MKLNNDYWIGLVLARPARTLALALIAGAGAISLASGLQLDTGFAALLPTDTPEVTQVRELSKKAGGTMELVVAVSGGDPGARLDYARSLVARLRPQPWIRWADVEYPVDFFRKRRLLLASPKALGELETAVDEAIQRAKARAMPLYVDLEDDQGPDPWSQVDRLESQGMEFLKETYTSPDGKYLFVRTKPVGTTFDFAAGKKLLHKLEALLRDSAPAKYGVSARLSGGLVVNQEQDVRMNQDLRRASVVALALILLVLTLYVRQLRAPLIIAIPLIIGVATTLAFARITVGQLNLVTGFLVSALFGLGVDYEIHLYLRFLELLRVEPDRHKAICEAVRRTFPSCLTSATTSAAAFFAMAISDFRGFREYGIIAGTGVLLTLTATFVVLPPLLKLLGGRPRRELIRKHPRRLPLRLAAAAVMVGSGFLIYSAIVVPDVRWRSDFKKLRGISDHAEFSEYVSLILGGDLTPAAIFVKNTDEARRVGDYLAQRVKEPESPINQYLSLASMVPTEVEAKLAVVRRIDKQLRSVLDHKLKKEDRKRVNEALTLTRVEPWTLSDVPKVFRRQFETIDNSGQFVIVWPSFLTNVDQDVMAWGRELERIRKDLAARGIAAPILDETRVTALVLQRMRADAPLVLVSAGLAVVLLLLLDFRSLRHVLLVAGTLAVGITWMLGLMRAYSIDINVFNQAVLPTIVGVGIDNVVHIYHRYVESNEDIATVLSTTGSAALLASLTTAIGFGATITAHHYGVQSLGWLAIIGLASTLVASTVFFPSVLRLLQDRHLPHA